MSDLLSIGRSGVMAYQGALAAVGQNVTNADTDGYSRRSVVLTEQTTAAGPYTLSRSGSAFGGVQASQVQRVWDQYQAQSAWSANSDASRASTRLQYLTSVETTLGDGTNGVAAKLTAVFTNATQLAANPSDTAARQTMLSAINDAATAIGQTDADLAKITNTVSSQAQSLVDQTNTALGTLAKVNTALKTAPLGSASRADLEDQRDSLIGSISSNIGIDVTIDANTGAASLKLSDYSGPQLLSSNSITPAVLSIAPSNTGQLAMTLTVGTATSAATPTGGALSGLVDVSNTIAGRRQSVDAIASQFVTQLNSWNRQGKTLTGAAGGDLLDPAGLTAATIKLTATDPGAIAAGSTSATDNGNLLTLSTLRGTAGVEAKWQSMANAQALLVSSATTESTAAASSKDSAYSMLDETTGVDLDTEAANLLRYQQAYSASAKIISTARDTLNSILALFN
ncbi:flagellar hook-associated protein 1 FlgK [Sphingomonas vulcanisoli]|uniref:Flagellar hook-associated protein 1 n=1 Tax=Sphingomonas vulcanisoli TaxID=1658060 RepID=A0ABX0TX33_9SPHN|nr:flagellar hook-associated protein FlgK [Sphingomonas vulcanisoli]NIJ08997.1 flagellar hook-associated protein 1 FlgK [Sphingomonas vulcanisoli]